jgi:hypothetical protein
VLGCAEFIADYCQLARNRVGSEHWTLIQAHLLICV